MVFGNVGQVVSSVFAEAAPQRDYLTGDQQRVADHGDAGRAPVLIGLGKAPFGEFLGGCRIFNPLVNFERVALRRAEVLNLFLDQAFVFALQIFDPRFFVDLVRLFLRAPTGAGRYVGQLQCPHRPLSFNIFAFEENQRFVLDGDKVTKIFRQPLDEFQIPFAALVLIGKVDGFNGALDCQPVASANLLDDLFQGGVFMPLGLQGPLIGIGEG